MTSPPRTELPRPKLAAPPSTDSMLWVSVAIEVLAIGAAVAFAYQHAAS